MEIGQILARIGRSAALQIIGAIGAIPIGSHLRSFVAQYDSTRNNISNAVNDTTHASYEINTLPLIDRRSEPRTHRFDMHLSWKLTTPHSAFAGILAPRTSLLWHHHLGKHLQRSLHARPTLDEQALHKALFSSK